MDITTENILIFSLVAVVVVLVISYHIIKAAVKNGILEARNEVRSMKRSLTVDGSGRVDETKSWTTEQVKLKESYERGEITLAEYQKRFNG